MFFWTNLKSMFCGGHFTLVSQCYFRPLISQPDRPKQTSIYRGTMRTFSKSGEKVQLDSTKSAYIIASAIQHMETRIAVRRVGEGSQKSDLLMRVLQICSGNQGHRKPRSYRRAQVRVPLGQLTRPKTLSFKIHNIIGTAL